MAGLTVKQTPLLSPGNYPTTTPTLTGGSGQLKPFGGEPPYRRSILKPPKSVYYGGKRGSNPDTRNVLKNIPRKIES